MSFRDLFHKSIGCVSHLPTWFFIIGYPVFWLQLYLLRVQEGLTSPIVWILWLAIAAGGIVLALRSVDFEFTKIQAFWRALTVIERLFIALGASLCFLILLIIARASFLPIHLIQEFDCLEYHYTLPHQHLILGSFAHIPWAADDLFLLPIDFSLAPFWYSTYLPNKIPQFFILIGLLMIVVRLVRAILQANRWLISFILIFVILGSHGLGIQMGTGMLDLTICYLFFAALDSLRNGKWGFAAIEFTFFFWSKPLMPLQVMFILGVLIIIVSILKSYRWKMIYEFELKKTKRFFLLFLILSTVVAGPFLIKSIHYAATPLFPLGLGMVLENPQIKTNPIAWESLQKASTLWMNSTKDSYGYGRDFIAFLKHWWLLAVPSQGVNNAFDYPLGLPYLLLIGPFLWGFLKDTCSKKVSIFYLLVIVSWGLWWFGSQQTRFLYIPILLVFIMTLSRMVRVSKILLSCLIVALFLHVLSLWGAHKKDFFLSPQEVIRIEDQKILDMAKTYENESKEFQEWDRHDVAYAKFPVVVKKESLPHTIKFQ